MARHSSPKNTRSALTTRRTVEPIGLVLLRVGNTDSIDIMKYPRIFGTVDYVQPLQPVGFRQSRFEKIGVQY